MTTMRTPARPALAAATALATTALALTVLPSSAMADPTHTGGQGNGHGTTLYVAQDGSTPYSTVQAAVDAVPSGNARPVTIVISAGTNLMSARSSSIA